MFIAKHICRQDMQFRGMTLSSSSQWWLPVGRETSGNEQKRGEALPVSSFSLQKQRARVKANMARIHTVEMGAQRSTMLCSKLLYSVIRQIFSDHLLCVRHCSRLSGHRDPKRDPCSHDAHILFETCRIPCFYF